MSESSQPGTWTRRRRFMYAITAFCMVVIGYVLLAGKTGAPAESAVTMSFVVLIGNVGSYVFGATWDDMNARKMR